MAKKITDTKYYQAIADAIRAKTGSSDDRYTPENMAAAIEKIQSLEVLEYVLQNKAFDGVLDLSNLNITEIADYAMYRHTNFSGEIILPESCKSIYQRAFEGCNITNITLSKVTRLDDCAFIAYGDKSLKMPYVDLASLVKIGESAFAGCTDIEEVYIGTALHNSLPLQNIFNGCTGLVRFLCDSQSSTAFGPKSFNGCTSLKYLLFPHARGGLDGEIIKSFDYADEMMPALKVVDYGPTTAISTAVHPCSGLTVIAFRCTNMVIGMTSADMAFCSSSPIRTGSGFILVPRALIASYEAATNWAVLSAEGTQFLALEDYTEDGTTTGYLDLDKVDALYTTT